MDNLPAFKELYLKTAKENILVIKSGLQKLNLNPADQTALEEVYRAAHTLKSKSAVMEKTIIVNLAKSIEDSFYSLQENKSQATTELLQTFHETLNQIEKNLSSQIKLLIAEDDEFFQKFYMSKLSEKGIEVILAINGEEAIQKTEQANPDIILLDIIMPKKDGFEVLAILKQDPNTQKIPVIVLSSLGQKQEREKALQLGAVDYVNKGFYDFDSLLLKIENYCVGRKT